MPDLITTQELAAALERPDRPIVLDVRWSLSGPPGEHEYRAGHLPGAVFADLDRDLAAPPGTKGRHPLPDPERLEQAARSWGIGPDSTVVCYDSGGALSAARAWWVLRWAGLSDVRVLDGGFGAWVAEGRPVVSDVPEPVAGTVRLHPGAMAQLDSAAAADLAGKGALLDVRTPERYRGENEPVDPVAGHIPGARNAPIAETLRADGTFRPAAELAEYFRGLGISGQEPIGAYCGSGVTAAQAVLALRQAGFDAALYVGSWSEWCADPGRPVATGTESG